MSRSIWRSEISYSSASRLVYFIAACIVCFALSAKAQAPANRSVLDSANEIRDCFPHELKCDSGECVWKGWRCDGDSDCADGSDELNCTDHNVHCNETSFLCPHGSPEWEPFCIDKSQLCDGVRDCSDNFDENEESCSSNLCPSLRCSHQCRASPEGGKCSCPLGQSLNPEDNSCYGGNECGKWGFCDHFCSIINGIPKCSCQEGYVLSQNKHCVAPNQNQFRIYFASEDRISKANGQGKVLTTWSANTSTAFVAGIDYHLRKRALFWIDAETSSIHTMPLATLEGDFPFNMEFKVVGEWVPTAIAVDWISDKIYVIDAWGRKIDVLDLESDWHTIVVRNLTDPGELALDPTSGLLFWSERESISRSGMDGLYRTDLIREPRNITGLTVDLGSKRIFWSSFADEHYIETVDYDGQNRYTIVKGPISALYPTSLAVFEQSVFWTDLIKESVRSVNKFTGQSSVHNVYRSVNSDETPKFVRTVHRLQQPKSSANPCGTNNGGCQHMCLISQPGASVDGALSFRCSCGIGYRLADDLSSCLIPTEFFLYAQRQSIKGSVSDAFGGPADAIAPVASRQQVHPTNYNHIGLDFDSYNEYIYYAETDSSAVNRVTLNGTNRQVVMEALTSGLVMEQIALDWASSNLYCTERTQDGNRFISVVNVRNPNYSPRLMLHNNIGVLGGLVVHPNKGYLFFSELIRSKITRSHLDGSHSRTIKYGVTYPKGLTIDYQLDRLYWYVSTPFSQIIQHSKLDGTDVQTISHTSFRRIQSMYVFKNTLFVSDEELGGIMRLNKHSNVSSLEKTLHEPDVFNLKVYSKESQPIHEEHPCVVNNGGCEKFCFAVPTYFSTSGLRHQCACPEGESLAPDGYGCVAIAREDPFAPGCPDPYSYFRCNDSTCIPKSYRCDSEVDCADYSDEIDCPNITCRPDRFSCDNGRCVPRYAVCDRSDDCGDYSDELQNCSTYHCQPTHFRCLSGRCIPLEYHCDSHADCEHGDDENDCPAPTGQVQENKIESPIAINEYDYFYDYVL